MTDWTTPKTWSAGEVVSDDDLNEQIRDNTGYLYASVVRARAQTDATLIAMTTTEDIQATATLVIPADWNTYDVDAWAKLDWLDGGAAASATLTVKLKVSGSDQLQNGGIEEIQIANTQDQGIISLVAGESGKTATGNVAVDLTTQLSAESTNYDCRLINLIAYAWRTS